MVRDDSRYIRSASPQDGTTDRQRPAEPVGTRHGGTEFDHHDDDQIYRGPRTPLSGRSNRIRSADPRIRVRDAEAYPAGTVHGREYDFGYRDRVKSPRRFR